MFKSVSGETLASLILWILLYRTMKSLCSFRRILTAALLVFLPILPVGTVEIVRITEERSLSARELDQFVAPLFHGYSRSSARYGADITELRIRSHYPDGTPTEVRVQVFVPRMDLDEAEGVYVFMPGTTGLIEPCRPSREHIAGIRWGLYRAHTLAMVGEGFIGILPDYLGFEDWHIVQPYFHSESEARILFDALHGADQWIRSRHPPGLENLIRVAGGFSQGGHAVFAAADRNHLLGRQLPLHGVIGFGATLDIEPVLLSYPSLTPMLTQAMLEVYGESRFNPRDILQSPWVSSLEEDTTRQCVGAMQSYYPGRADHLLTPTFLAALRNGTVPRDFPDIAAVFDANRAGVVPHRIPALITQGSNDIVISADAQERTVARLQALGIPVEYRLYPGARHDTRQIAFPDVLQWIRLLRDQESSR